MIVAAVTIFLVCAFLLVVGILVVPKTWGDVKRGTNRYSDRETNQWAAPGAAIVFAGPLMMAGICGMVAVLVLLCAGMGS